MTDASNRASMIARLLSEMPGIPNLGDDLARLSDDDLRALHVPPWDDLEALLTPDPDKVLEAWMAGRLHPRLATAVLGVGSEAELRDLNLARLRPLLQDIYDEHAVDDDGHDDSEGPR